jgi:indole-3-glycerol phosphate synthase
MFYNNLTLKQCLKIAQEMIDSKKRGFKEKKNFSLFEAVLSKVGINFICEVKKASSSKGLISNDFRYKEIALKYEQAVAAAISVLTEPDFFLAAQNTCGK